MKVALIAPSYLPRQGILDRHVRELAAGLSVHGVEVDILTQQTRPWLPPVSEVDGFLIRRFATAIRDTRVGVAPRLWDQLRHAAAAYDLVHVHSDYASVPLATARAGPRRLVFTPYVAVERLLRRPYGGFIRALMHHGAQILCASGVQRKMLLAMFPAVADRISVVSHGVDIAAIRAAQPFHGQGNVLVTAGRLERQRRVDRAIASVAGLDAGFRLVVIGDGPDRERLIARAADLRVSSRVSFVRSVSDTELYRWLRTASVVLTLAEEEPSGYHLSQALAADTRVVAADIPVHREAATRVGGAGVTFVSPAGSPLEVARAIDEAARSSSPMTERVRLPTWGEAVERTLAAYTAVVRRSGRIASTATSI